MRFLHALERDAGCGDTVLVVIIVVRGIVVVLSMGGGWADPALLKCL